MLKSWAVPTYPDHQPLHCSDSSPCCCCWCCCCWCCCWWCCCPSWQSGRQRQPTCPSDNSTPAAAQTGWRWDLNTGRDIWKIYKEDIAVHYGGGGSFRWYFRYLHWFIFIIFKSNVVFSLCAISRVTREKFELHLNAMLLIMLEMWFIACFGVV